MANSGRLKSLGAFTVLHMQDLNNEREGVLRQPISPDPARTGILSLSGT